MRQCITYFAPKGKAIPQTGFDVPIRAPLILPPLDAASDIIWAIIGSDGSVIGTSSQIIDVSRTATGTYQISWSVDRPNSDYIISRYADNERFNNLRLGRWSRITSKTTNSFIIEWYEMSSNTLIDTYFSITIY